ncbi:hypothetical protein WICPIJ_008536 [Wickerhamomyces pijperi]|uniref:Ubiquitin-like domain-containing protein n=1 Tax=Wickerhamomyces pijperi TaxID=599730 RepID=A0A9P8PWU1_WICPI|nr:hypothetical protein WICPIJ_008536 [Wickerhamomyces pijperi]
MNRSSVDKKYEFTISSSITVLELKEKIAAESDIETSAQRLIYSGRVLKDNDTIGSYNIKTGHTIHLVKSAAARAASATTTTTNAQSAPTSTTSQTPAAPSNISTGQGTFNPLADLTGARYAGYAQLPSASMFGPDGGMTLPSEDEMDRMMSNPMFQQSMNQMLNNPQMLDYMIQQNPQLAAMGPQVREMLQSDYFRQMLSNPQMMRQMRQMQSMFGGGMGGAQAASSFPAPGEATASNSTPDSSTPQPTNTPASTATATPAVNPFAAFIPGAGAGAATAANPFAAFGGSGQGGFPQLDPALLQSMFGGAGAAAPVETDNRPPEVRFETQLRQLNDMGFYDYDANIEALRRSGGSVEGAIANLFNN